MDRTSAPGDAGLDCTRCGACCASYRVSFYWAEGEALPPALIEPLAGVLACLRGTNRVPIRCDALQGSIGERVHCSVYDRRPSPCRSVQPGDDQCRRARTRHGLG